MRWSKASEHQNDFVPCNLVAIIEYVVYPLNAVVDDATIIGDLGIYRPMNWTVMRGPSFMPRSSHHGWGQ